MSRWNQSTSERFWAKVNVIDDADSCWMWTAAQLPKGYGRFGMSRSQGVMLAHRMSYILSHGAIPEGMHIDHLCYQPSCVRPSHLRAVTPKQNTENRRGANRNNSSGFRGVSWHAKSGKWRASVKHNRITVWAETFDTIEEAATAVVEARSRFHTHNDQDRAA